MAENSGGPDLAVEDLRGRIPGEDPEDPYEDVDISELPGWWQRAIEEHEAYGLRPYRPPRFDDGVLRHTVVERLERQLDVAIDFIDLDVENDTWKVRVDGEIIGEVPRRRSTAGYSVYELDSDEFVTFVRSLISEP